MKERRASVGVDGPIGLAAAVAAGHQWKYNPYLLRGHPVTVATQIQVNYQLRTVKPILSVRQLLANGRCAQNPRGFKCTHLLSTPIGICDPSHGRHGLSPCAPPAHRVERADEQQVPPLRSE
jgi:hypothetical protein